MRNRSAFTSLLGLLVFLMITGLSACGQSKPENWTAAQLEQPETLSRQLKENKNLPVIICVGPGAIIPHSLNARAMNGSGGPENFKKIISRLEKDERIVIYCGCCPFEHCPNVRPAIDLLKSGGFTNYRLLNLPKNINADWISKGYPVQNQ